MIAIDRATYTYPFQKEPSLRDVSLHVGRGQAVLLTGPSGGGKSTLLRLINGLIPRIHGGTLEGRIVLNGSDPRPMSLRQISGTVATLFQDPQKQFLALTVAEEIGMALEWRAMNPADISRRVDRVMADFGLEQLDDASIYDLSDGQKQKVALASLLALEPQMLVLDEPTANLDPQASAELAAHLTQLKTAGVTLIIADHRLAWLKDLIDEVHIVDQGRIAKSGDWSILQDSALRQRHGLRSACYPKSTAVRVHDPGACESAVRWEQLTFGYRGREALFNHATLGIARGSVTAITGSNGCGKTTLARLMAGLVRPKRGTLLMDGQPIRPRDLLAITGMAMQNSELQLYQRSVLAELLHALPVRRCRDNTLTAMQWLERFGLGGVADRHPQSLSGGQKQRLVVACAAARAEDLLILDEPTSGLDGAQVRALAELLEERRSNGLTSLVVTHDPELIARACTCELRLPVKGQSQKKCVRDSFTFQETA